MSISIIKTPITLINGHKSKWLPAHQPITFEIQRRDATIMQFTGIKENGVITKLRITINWDLNVIQAKAGQRVVIFKPVPITLTIASIISSNVLDVYITSTSQIPTIYNLINFFLTNKNEIYLNPTFGGNLRAFIFQQISTGNLDSLKEDIQYQLGLYFPSVIIGSLNIDSFPDINQINVVLKYNIQETGLSDTVEIVFT